MIRKVNYIYCFNFISAIDMSVDIGPFDETSSYRSREEVTQAIIFQKMDKSLSWGDISNTIGMSLVPTVAACLGQLAFDSSKAAALMLALNLHQSAEKWLTLPPYRGTPTDLILRDPFLQRLFEVFSVYGPALKALSAAEFGDGLIDTANFSIDMQKVEHPAGDRARVSFSGRFQRYEPF